jgi:dolichol-phosphate mannosyltransferase
VIGSRYVPGGSIPDWNWGRRAISRGGCLYARSILGLSVHDATAGFRAYRRAILQRIPLDTVRADGYGFQVEMTYLTERVGGRVIELPITFRDRTLGRSKMSMRIVVEAFVLVAWWGARDRLRRLSHRFTSARD